MALPYLSPTILASSMSELCYACGGQFEPNDGGETHAYMMSLPGCWAAYGELLTREYSDPVLFAALHRLSVDAYAVQHPGDPAERRAVQSFWIHGASLWLVLRMDQSHIFATQALQALAGLDFAERPFDQPHFAMTHADVLASPVAAHGARTRDWAEESLTAWGEAHAEFERLARLALGEKAPS